jgi:hypothetical protein
MIDDLVIANLEFYTSMNTEDADAFVKDLLYALFARYSQEELNAEAERIL